jgi:hypothetical protein
MARLFNRARARGLTVVLVAAGLVASAGTITWAGFNSLTANTGDEVQAGTVGLSDNDSGNAALSLSSANPGDTDSDCIRVDYDGTLAATLRLYGATTGSGLDPYLALKVTRGVYSPSDPGDGSCTNFQADSTNYIGAGAGVVYNGTLQNYPDDYATGIDDPPSGGPATWTAGTKRVYRLEVALQSDFAAQNKDATQTFTWEARNQ